MSALYRVLPGVVKLFGEPSCRGGSAGYNHKPPLRRVSITGVKSALLSPALCTCGTAPQEALPMVGPTNTNALPGRAPPKRALLSKTQTEL